MKLKYKTKAKLLVLLYISVMLLTVCVSVNLALPERQIYFESTQSATVSAVADSIQDAGEYKLRAKLFGAIPVKNVSVEVLPETELIPCGDVFGIKFFTKGVIVIGTTEIETEDGYINPAQKAGIFKNDIINKVDGVEVNTVEALAAAVEKSGGNTLSVEYTHDGKSTTCVLKPVKSSSDGRYKTGIWVRDSTAGIGTMTYYNPNDGSFAGLGHGICDIDTGELMPLLKGTVVDVDVTEIVKGKSGTPGELKGSFSSLKKGSLYGNTGFGVYGILDSVPETVGKPISIAGRSEVTDGKATILCNVDGNGVDEYAVKLSKVDHRSDGTKCFVIEITDKKLLELTGGIVQGMSGSPIIQNGKLVGAVTHVLVNDPSKGYGIFIENMISRMKNAA